MIRCFSPVSGDIQLYRGGQPEVRADWQFLSDLGIKQVIKLNEDYEGTDRPFQGTELMKCPIGPVAQILTGPDRQSLIDAVGFIREDTFVHCSHGQDRTGLVIAMYRVKHCGWSKAEAEEEMLGYGFHKMLLGLWCAWLEFRPADEGQKPQAAPAPLVRR